MKKMLTYKLFLEQDEIEIDTFYNDLKKEIDLYKSKKTTLENLYKRAEEDDVQNFNNEILTKVYGNESDVDKRNKFLKAYEQILQMNLWMVKAQLNIERENGAILEWKEKINTINSKLGDTDDNNIKTELNNQLQQAKKHIEELKTSILDNRNKITLKTSEIDDLKKNFQKMMEAELDKLNNKNQ